MFAISLVFTEIILVSYLVQVLSRRLLPMAFSFCSSSAKASMCLTHRRLVIVLLPIMFFQSIRHDGENGEEGGLVREDTMPYSTCCSK